MKGHQGNRIEFIAFDNTLPISFSLGQMLVLGMFSRDTNSWFPLDEWIKIQGRQ